MRANTIPWDQEKEGFSFRRRNPSEAVKKLEYAPLTPTLSRKGRGWTYWNKTEIPSPLMGEGEGGGDLWDFFTPSKFRVFLSPFGKGG